MNQEKVREFFSAYYEGTLDPGLQQTMSATLTKDPVLLDEYRKFERTYEELAKLKYEVVEIPFDLHARITSRLDQHVEETNKSLPAGWTIWVRNVALAGVAAAAIVGAVLSLRPSTGTEVSPAGVNFPVTTEEAPARVDAVLRQGVVKLEFSPSEPKTVEIRKGLEGEVLRTVELDGNSMSSPLENTGDSAIAFAATVKEDRSVTVVAVPGKLVSSDASPSGEGTLEQFALALANAYNVPVLLQVQDPKAPVKWDLTDEDVVRAATSVLDKQAYNVMKRESGLVSITAD
jgi:hypothetical protein